jgi:hypothetical protein
MFVDSPDGIVTVDLERLDRMDRLAEGTTSRPAEAELAPRGPALVPAEGHG